MSLIQYHFLTALEHIEGIQIAHDQGKAEVILIVDTSRVAQEKLALEILSRHPQARIMQAQQLATLGSELYSTCIVVFLLELKAPMHAVLDELSFSTIRRRIQNSNNILWLSSASYNSGTLQPSLSTALGLFRTIRNEYSSKHIVKVSLESLESGSE